MLQENAVQPAALALLKKLVALEDISSFALGGGTNLALRYGHRMSDDLDFFTNEKFDKPQLFQVITKTFPSAELLFEQNQTMLFVIDEIRADFVLYPFQWFLPFEETGGTRLISIKDIIPMKLQAVSNRNSKKDYWDIAMLLGQYPLREMILLFKEKFPQVDEGYIIHSLTDFEEAEDQFDPDSLNNRTWTDVKRILSEAVSRLTEDSL